MEVIIGPYGPEKPERVVTATADPRTLPNLTTFYLEINLPAPRLPRAYDSGLVAASNEEVVHLYGLDMSALIPTNSQELILSQLSVSSAWVHVHTCARRSKHFSLYARPPEVLE